MSSEMKDIETTPMIRLLGLGFDAFTAELNDRIHATEFSDLRAGHGCVFGNIDPESGSRLTELAERALMTKQSVGEVVTDLVQRGYVERVADPSDGRAKIIRLTQRGREAYVLGRQLINEIERDWGERYGEERVSALREALEAVVAGRVGVPA
jgi:DNA-binding MarR family transcriptional regulator